MRAPLISWTVLSVAVACSANSLCNTAVANHEVLGGIEMEGGYLFMGAPPDVQYSMIHLKIVNDAPENIIFNTGMATWLGQENLAIIDTLREQGFEVQSGEVNLPNGGFGFPRGFHLGELLPVDSPLLTTDPNPFVDVTFTQVGVPGIQRGQFVPTAIPEPSGLVLCVLGGFGLLDLIRRDLR